MTARNRNKYNYNYVFLFYDVEECRCNKVFKVCKKYLSHYQKSVFRGEISPSRLISLKRDLKKVIEKNKDYVSIIKFINQSYFHEENLGLEVKKEEVLIL
ncbi:CRISPR-associated endonuclease Cas2 [Abyssisolibacter fermentans]|uniref:CRISPR-associated endonuclease Cas2 n=1 Tax=Abyssisolibacter fermentans TaxID=1766203 RepID=UPI000833C743|nr:CRISPR-associated endonuclease Cas2 [Abyssisolibacter fermentans]